MPTSEPWKGIAGWMIGLAFVGMVMFALALLAITFNPGFLILLVVLGIFVAAVAATALLFTAIARLFGGR